MNINRRHFNRIIFNTHAELDTNQLKINCEVIDLSIKGIFLDFDKEIVLDKEPIYQLKVPLDSENTTINMRIKLKHKENNKLGFECIDIDLDSITHLRRLMELNSGNSELLERDFEMLVKDNSHPTRH